jgi:hypothetical protein
MARDDVADIVNRLRERRFEPRPVGGQAWESRCPVHRGKEHALSITRGERQEAVLSCRARQCSPAKIAAALDLTLTRACVGATHWKMRELHDRQIMASISRASTRDEFRTEAPPPPALRAFVPATPCGPSVDAASAAVRQPQHAPSQQVAPENLHSQTADNEAHPGHGTEAPAPSGATSPAAGANVTKESASAAPSLTSTDTGPGKERAVDGLLRTADRAQLFRLAGGRLCARLPIEGREEIHGLRSAEFRDWLVDAYIEAGGKLPSKWSLRCAIEALETKARHHGASTIISTRVGTEANAVSPSSSFYIDLADRAGRAVVVAASGWSIVDRPPIAFRRPEGLLPLPVPSRDGSIELLRSYVNLSDRDFRLLIAWLAAALRPVGPYPILALYGEQGSAKSTTARIVRALVDPHSSPLLIGPKGTRDLMITALNGWLLAYDNLSTIPTWFSDGLCLVSTGGAYSGRTEFTTLERTTFHVQRPCVLTGIDEFIRRGDLSDRSLILHLPPIPPGRRRREDQLWQAFTQDQPRIFGGLLDAIAGGLRALPGLELAGLPRMADFAAGGEAIGRALGWPPGTFLADYEANRREASAAQIEDSLIATALLHDPHRFHAWNGSPANLHSELTAVIGRRAAASARWPKSPRWFNDELRRIAPVLRMHGISITFGRTYGGRFIAIELANPNQNSDMRITLQ